jgi:hypothetical protein
MFLFVCWIVGRKQKFQNGEKKENRITEKNEKDKKTLRVCAKLSGTLF